LLFSDKELTDDDCFVKGDDSVEEGIIKEFVSRLNLCHIVAFTTGSSEVPPIGFNPRTCIRFVHDDGKILPSANTCGNELVLFVNGMTLANNILSRNFIKAIFSLV
jgi:hypothetical protein